MNLLKAQIVRTPIDPSKITYISIQSHLMKKVLYILLGLLAVAIMAIAIYVFTAPDIPANTDAIIEQITEMNLPEFYTGEEGYAQHDEVQLWYEKMAAKGGQTKGTVLLIMGYTSTSLMWPAHFYDHFLEAGYDVIRYDHRDIGKSTWSEEWSEEDPYTLEDMADDARSILSDAGVDQAHIIGISMGGMIAQTFAIRYPEVTQTLTSMSSTAYFDDESLPGIWPETERNMGRYILKYSMGKDAETFYRFRLTAKALFAGKNYEPDFLTDALKARYELEKRGGVNDLASERHEKAIQVSGSRYEALKKLDEPTLIIHGRADPLVNFAHGEKTAALIPNAKTLYFDDLGHDIPPQFSGEMTDAILQMMDEHSPEAVVGDEVVSMETK